MLVCPVCSEELEDEGKLCGTCKFSVATREGFATWAPELADHNSGFRAEYFSDLAQVESAHFWFRARNALIIWALKTYFPNFHSLLEVGCGSGFVLSGIAAAFPHARLVGSEIFVAGLEVASSRIPGAELVQMDARKLPYVDEFDVVTAFDVIEHIDEDVTVLQNFFRAVKPGGGCIITVPQHKWLWSPVDEEACHKRRYTAAELHGKMEAAGFKILRTTSFVALLLPLMLTSRLRDKRVGKSGGVDSLRMNKTLNSLLETILNLERRAINAGLNWPLGGSRLVVAQKILSS
ncbi:class I SAM-dependent methyltransferase [Herbaspirillum lusitanum]|uniref:methyltransferase domain-containing protein n=1 Tax=Herbaspirillum lusitanum TaxID=213312 RepID=UPI00223741BA|nr:methyltransferase domain-containing protein [Herbaspirillum lusitanum]MCW5299427.1 class I SAM-dependent methyltransferase [Herbaspirillum lusitanum]